MWYKTVMIPKWCIYGTIIIIISSLCLFCAAEATPTLEEKVSQMLLIGFRGTAIPDGHETARTLRDIPIGGVVLFDYDVPSGSFPRNIINPRQIRKLTARLQSLSQTPLLIAVDAEGGRVNRLRARYGFLDIPSAAEAGKAKTAELSGIYRKLAAQLAAAGVNLNLAPVVDVNVNPDNPVIGGLGRSFSSDPEKVVEYARAFISAHRGYKVLTAIKHFPGHGGSCEDSHLGLTDITDTFTKQEYIPFKKIIMTGLADAVMTAHVMNRNIDPEYPATLSPRFIQKILREQWNYSGVVISDDLHMGAILNHYSFSDAVVQAAQAGCDLLAISNNGRKYDPEAAYKARDALLQAVLKGRLSEESVTLSYQRIMRLKQSAGILSP